MATSRSAVDSLVADLWKFSVLVLFFAPGVSEFFLFIFMMMVVRGKGCHVNIAAYVASFIFRSGESYAYMANSKRCDPHRSQAALLGAFIESGLAVSLQAKLCIAVHP